MLQIIGHENVLGYLEKSLAAKRVAHAYFFAGPRHIGKTTVAAWWVAKLLNLTPPKIKLSALLEPFARLTHPDLILLTREEEKEKISVEAAREFIRKLAATSFLGGRKVGLILEAETLSAGAGNALLKTLEEPTASSIIIFCAPSPESVLPTIRSRAELLRFLPVKSERLREVLIENGLSGVEAASLAESASGLPGLAIRLAFDKELREEQTAAREGLTNILKGALFERFAFIEKLCKEVGEDDDKRESLLRLLFFWEIEARRALSVAAGLLPPNQSAVLGEISQKPESAAKLLKVIDAARENIKAYVQPKMAFEQIALAF